MDITLNHLSEKQQKHLASNGFGSKVNAPLLSKNPICVKFSEEADSFLRSLPDRNDWLRDVVNRAMALEATALPKPTTKRKKK